MDNNEQRFVTIDEASKILAVDRRTMKKLIKLGKFRARNTNATGNEREYWKVWLPDLLKPDNKVNKRTLSQ